MPNVSSPRDLVSRPDNMDKTVPHTVTLTKNVTVSRNFKKFHTFLAHLSLRLIDELIGYSWSGVRPSSSVHHHRPQCSKIFSKTDGPIKAKFYVEPPWVGGTIFCSGHLGHMTKMAATPIYGKNPSKSSSEPAGRFSRNLVCSIGTPAHQNLLN